MLSWNIGREEVSRMLVLKMSGKAREVFGLLKLLAEKRGHVTLGELAKEGARWTSTMKSAE